MHGTHAASHVSHAVMTFDTSCGRSLLPVVILGLEHFGRLFNSGVDNQSHRAFQHRYAQYGTSEYMCRGRCISPWYHDEQTVTIFQDHCL